MDDRKRKEYEARLAALQKRHDHEREAMERRHRLDTERLKNQYSNFEPLVNKDKKSLN
jgi:hypothetical protein